jgi:hypothetical protein
MLHRCIQGLLEMGLKGLALPKATAAWLQRVHWLQQHGCGPQCTALPDLSERALFEEGSDWLEGFVAGARSKAELQKLNWGNILR